MEVLPVKKHSKSVLSALLLTTILVCNAVVPAFAASNNGVDVDTSGYWYVYGPTKHGDGSYAATTEDMAARQLYAYGLIDSDAAGAGPATAAEAVRLISAVTGTDAACALAPTAQTVTKETLYGCIGRCLGWTWSTTEELYAMAAANGIMTAGIGETVTAGGLYVVVGSLIDAACYDAVTVTRGQVATPAEVKITVSRIEDADAQIRNAMTYAPNRITVSFTGDVPEADRKALAGAYEDWKRTSDDRSAWLLTAVETNVDEPLGVAYRDGVMTLTVRYGEGWTAFVDVRDWLKYYADTAYSKDLAAFHDEHIAPIAHSGASDEDKFLRIVAAITDNVTYDYAALNRMQKNGYRYTGDAQAHSIRGLIDRGTFVCQGYAAALVLACASCDIPAVSVIGVKDGGNHVLNKVRLDGSWHAIDLMSDDFLFEARAENGDHDIALWLFDDAYLARDWGFNVYFRYINTVAPARSTLSITLFRSEPCL